MALLTSPYITKIKYSYEEESYPQFNEKTGDIEPVKETVGRVKIQPVSPFDLVMDPDGENYVIETKHCTVGEYQNLSRVNN